MPHPADHELIQAAIEASRNAYIPYSGYAVGAALLTIDGAVYTGCNIENAGYSPTVCAERTALFKAVSEGQRQFASVAVVTRDGGSPCGVCRQAMFEFSPGMTVLMADLEGKLHRRATLAELLPYGFGPANLQ